MNSINPLVLSGQTSITITFLASFLIWVMFLGFFILWLVDGRFKKEQALYTLFSSFLAWGMSQMIKIFFPTIRPFQFYGTMPMTLSIPLDGSFPSAHAASAFGLAVSIWLHNKRVGLIFIIGAAFVGIGRILSNVHFPLDVLVGSIIGIISSYLVSRFQLFKFKKTERLDF